MKSGALVAIWASVLATAVGASTPLVQEVASASNPVAPPLAPALSAEFLTVVDAAVAAARAPGATAGDPEDAAVGALQASIIQSGAAPERVVEALDLAMGARNCALDASERTYLTDESQRRYFVDRKGRRVYRDEAGVHYLLDAEGVRTDIAVEERWNSVECAAMARVLGAVKASLTVEEATGAIGDPGGGALPVGALAPPAAAGGSDYAAAT